MSIVRTVVGGVDTHADVHVAAAIDGNGGVLGIDTFPADTAGYRDLLRWLVHFGGHLGGIAPMGYGNEADPENPKRKRLVVVEAEADIFRYAVGRVLAGDNIQEVANALDARWPGFKGRRWSTGFSASKVAGWLRGRDLQDRDPRPHGRPRPGRRQGALRDRGPRDH